MAKEGEGFFILVVVLFGTFSYLLASMPSAIISNQPALSISQSYFYSNIPESFNLGSSNFSSADYKNITRDTPVTLHLSNKASNDTEIYIDWQSASWPYIEGIYNSHINSGAWPYGYCALDPTPITLDIVLNHVSAVNASSVMLSDSSKDIPGVFFRVMTNTTYASIYDSYQGGDLQVFVGFYKNMTQTEYQFNALAEVAKFMTFQSPNIDQKLNVIIALPIWAFIFIVILWILKGWL